MGRRGAFDGVAYVTQDYLPADCLRRPARRWLARRLQHGRRRWRRRAVRPAKPSTKPRKKPTTATRTRRNWTPPATPRRIRGCATGCGIGRADSVAPSRHRLSHESPSFLLARSGARIVRRAARTRARAPTAAAALEIRDAWAAPTPGGVDVSAGYLTIVNGTGADDRLICCDEPARVACRSARNEHGWRRDAHARASRRWPIPAGGHGPLAPGGQHSDVLRRERAVCRRRIAFRCGSPLRAGERAMDAARAPQPLARRTPCTQPRARTDRDADTAADALRADRPRAIHLHLQSGAAPAPPAASDMRAALSER